MKALDLIRKLEQFDENNNADVRINCPNDDASWQPHLIITDAEGKEIEIEL